MIDGSEKRNRQLAFELHNSHVCEKRSKKNKGPRILPRGTPRQEAKNRRESRSSP